MITIEQYRKLLPVEDRNLPDEQVKKMMDAEYVIVSAIFDQILEEQNEKKTGHKNP